MVRVKRCLRVALSFGQRRDFEGAAACDGGAALSLAAACWTTQRKVVSLATNSQAMTAELADKKTYNVIQLDMNERHLLHLLKLSTQLECDAA